MEVEFQHSLLNRQGAGINLKTICQLVPGLEQMSAVMMGGGTVEVKATIARAGCWPFSRYAVSDQKCIGSPDGLKNAADAGNCGLYRQLEVPLPENCKNSLTVKQIMTTNELTGAGLIKPGDRLLLVKRMS